ncbi:MAG: hypothetical protein R3C09_20355 [Pirellulaceae bacterium]
MRAPMLSIGLLPHQVAPDRHERLHLAPATLEAIESLTRSMKLPGVFGPTLRRSIFKFITTSEAGRAAEAETATGINCGADLRRR